MNLAELEKAVRGHRGEFLCHRIHNEGNKKTVQVLHVVKSASGHSDVPEAGGLKEFFNRFESIVFYYDPKSRDAGKYIAPPSEWTELQEAFSGWLEALDEEDRSEAVPAWVESCLVIGETPHSGNYILMATRGAERGHIFEFEHDGFEFIHESNDIVSYVEKLLKPDTSLLTEIASHMRFIEGNPREQWWIEEFKDNHGNVVRTKP
jgi:hypothetical protein